MIFEDVDFIPDFSHESNNYVNRFILDRSILDNCIITPEQEQMLINRTCPKCGFNKLNEINFEKMLVNKCICGTLFLRYTKNVKT